MYDLSFIVIIRFIRNIKFSRFSKVSMGTSKVNWKIKQKEWYKRVVLPDSTRDPPWTRSDPPLTA